MELQYPPVFIHGSSVCLLNIESKIWTLCIVTVYSKSSSITVHTCPLPSCEIMHIPNVYTCKGLVVHREKAIGGVPSEHHLHSTYA